MLKRFNNNHILEAGVDEAGRGCLAGPVVAAAVILPPNENFDWYEALNDSKQLPETMRDNLRILIERDALSWSVGVVGPQEIDQINILNATYQAMHIAISNLKIEPEMILVDGNRFKNYHSIPHKTIVKGDGIYLSIAAASVIAKTYRDSIMRDLHTEFPQYAWDRNKAYGTDAHVQAIFKYGLTPHHRKSFQLKAQQMTLF
jgi:ribonuclease HII